MASIDDRVAERIAIAHPCTSEGFLVQDLRLSRRTVDHAIRRLIKAGRIQRGWDGHNLEITDDEHESRRMDAGIRALLNGYK